MPSFLLPATDNNSYSADALCGSKATLVVFTCNHCPYARAYYTRLNELWQEFNSEGLSIIAISSNDAEEYPEDSFPNMQITAREAGFPYVYLYDSTQETARQFQATHTPECFLFDAGKRLVYYGKIDDNWREPEKVKNRYLRNAISEVLQGTEVSFPETYAIGCTIKWKNH